MFKFFSSLLIVITSTIIISTPATAYDISQMGDQINITGKIARNIRGELGIKSQEDGKVYILYDDEGIKEDTNYLPPDLFLNDALAKKVINAKKQNQIVNVNGHEYFGEAMPQGVYIESISFQ